MSYWDPEQSNKETTKIEGQTEIGYDSSYKEAMNTQLTNQEQAKAKNEASPIPGSELPDSKHPLTKS